MKFSLPTRHRFPAVLFLFLAFPAMADVPRKQPLTKYAKLWNDSPFTSKPIATAAAPERNVFEDYVLAGVSPIDGGYRVTLLHKKQPDERIYLESNAKNQDGFKILGVTKKTGDPLSTTVRLGRGTQTGIVSFDSKLLSLKTAPATPPGQNRPNNINKPNIRPIPLQNRNAQPTPPNQPQGRPRPRIVPPRQTPQR